MLDIEKKAMKYLCVKVENGKKVQYRNPDLWEQYSSTAFKRLCTRIEKKGEVFDYWKAVNKVSINESYVEDDRTSIYVYIGNIEKVNAVLEKLDTKSIQTKLGVTINGEKDSIHITTINEEMLIRCTLMLLCDVWDMGINLKIICNSKLAKDFCNYIEVHRMNVIFIENSIVERYSKEILLCGYYVSNNGIRPQPYRLDTVLASDVLNSLHSMKMVWENRRIFVENESTTTLYGILKDIQYILQIKRFGWENLKGQQDMVREHMYEIDAMKNIEKNKSNKKYPHRSYTFTNIDNDSARLLIWGCGAVKAINGIAADIREIFDLILKKKLEWPQCGENLIGILDGKKRAEIHLSEFNADKWIVWGKIDL